MGDGKWIWVDNLVIEHDTVEGTVYSIIDVICVYQFILTSRCGLQLNLHMTSAPSPSLCSSSTGVEGPASALSIARR